MKIDVNRVKIGFLLVFSIFAVLAFTFGLGFVDAWMAVMLRLAT